MRITFVIISIHLCCTALLLASSSHAQNITVDVKNTSVRKVLTNIETQASVSFVCDYRILEDMPVVTLKISSRPLSEVLALLEKQTPLRFKQSGNLIGISRITVKSDSTPPKETGALNVTAPPLNIMGKITDKDGRPLVGVTVKIKNGRSVSTDINGVFAVDAPEENSVIIFSYVGFTTQEHVVGSQRVFNIQMVASESKLDEVQVIAYGTTTQRLSTGSTSKVSGADIENQPVGNPLLAIQGHASGVSIQTLSGLPGGNVSVQIRGQGSIASGTNPLYIIDGVPFLSAPLAGNASFNGVISPFSVLNMDDIARIDILKDADATAIYGSRGANGVILITTKKGTAGKTNFTVAADHGYSEIARYLPFLNLQQYLQMRTEAFKNDGTTPTSSTAPDLLTWSQTQSINWEKYEFGNKAPLTRVQASLSGGNGLTNFLFSMNYRNEGYILPGNENYQKGGGYLNLTHTSADKKFNATVTVNYSLDDNHTIYSASTSIASLPPNYPIYNADGSYNFEANYNPVAQLNERSRIQSDNIITNSVLSYELLKGLNIKVSVGYTKYHINQLATLPQNAQSNLFSTPVATMFLTDNTSSSWIAEPQLNYSLKSSKGVLTALLGGTIQQRLDQGNSLTGTGVNNPDLLGNLSAAGTITGTNTYTDYKYVSLFSRINYAWQQEYILDVNFRRDGSSRFGSNRQFGNFGALGAAWVFTQENVVHDNLPWLSFGKLRASYGITGNDQIADYQYLTTYGSSTIYGGTASLAPSRIANPDYSWETTKQLETGIELDFIKDRIIFTTAWYQRRSDNQLVTYPLPYQSGFSGYQANLPADVQNTGWEFDLNTINIKGSEFSWSSSFNFTLPKNILLSYPGLAGSSYANTLVVGQDLSVFKGFHYIGVNPQTGIAQFEDVNHDNVIQFPQDVLALGKTSPVFYGGLGNSISYKRFKLDLFFEFRKQSSNEFKASYGSSVTNAPLFVLGSWQQPGDQAALPRYTTQSNNLTNYNASNGTFGDASYIRFKNIAFSYRLPSQILNKLNCKELSFFIQGQNILTFANKNRLDPEIPGDAASVPPLKTFVAGLKITF